VRLRLEACDAILFEGVKSWRVWVLTLSYSLVARRKRLGLVTQRDALSLKDYGRALFMLIWARSSLMNMVKNSVALPHRSCNLRAPVWNLPLPNGDKRIHR